MTEIQDVRIGIVGLGGIGQHHARHLQNHGVDLIGGMDIDASARDEFAQEFGVPVYEDANELFQHAEAVVITTPNRFHEEYAVRALDAGLDVLLEKPLAHEVESAERIVVAAEDAPGFCMVGFNNRFANPVQVFKSYQDEGRFGDINHVEANYVRQRGIPGRGSWFTSKDIAGGGALIDIGVHAIDLALYFMDYPEIVEVSGVTRSEFGDREDYAFVNMWGEDAGPEGFDVEDSASAFIRGADGQTISLEVAWATNRPTDDDFIIRGTEGGARFDRAASELTLFESGTGGGHHLADTTVETREHDAHRAELGVFLEAVAEGAHPGINTVGEALTVQRIIDAIYESCETGSTVRLE